MAKKIIFFLVLLIAAALPALHVLLSRGVTKAVREVVLPAVKQRLHVDVSAQEVGVNLFGGKAVVRNVRVASPEGFDNSAMLLVQRFAVNLGLLSLIRGGATDIDELSLNDAILTVIRNKEGDINLKKVLERLRGTSERPAGGPRPEKPAPTPPKGPASTAQSSTPKSLPPIRVGQLNARLLLQYFDEAVSQPPFSLGLEARLKVRNAATFGDPETLSGTFQLDGALTSRDRKYAFVFSGRLAPIVDPAAPSFDLDGSMESVDVRLFAPFASKVDIEGGFISTRLHLVCRNGVFDESRSVVNLTTEKIKVSAARLEKLGGVEPPETFTIAVPIGGTLTEPTGFSDHDLEAAFTRALFNPDNNLDDVFKSLLKKADRSVRDAIRSASPEQPPAPADGAPPAADEPLTRDGPTPVPPTAESLSGSIEP
ncbi:MAG: hypothetical protein HY343_10035 [Lentisphaerae bacterium]|nr:hypothetical protein [Lentisphaerota bacterium]